MSQYATIDDARRFGLNPTALGIDVTIDDVNAALVVRSAHFDAKARARYGNENLPLPAPYDVTIVQAVVHMATYDLLALRGYDESKPGDVAVYSRFLAAIKFCDDVERQTVHPLVAIAQSSAAGQPPVAQPYVLSQPLQGWLPAQSTGFRPPPSGIQ